MDATRAGETSRRQINQREPKNPRTISDQIELYIFQK